MQHGAAMGAAIRDLLLRAITEDDVSGLQALFERCGEYFEQAYGRAAGPDEAEKLRRWQPPGMPPGAKAPLGLFDRKGRLQGYCELARNFPVDGEWTLGLVLLAPERRGRGLGSQLYLALEHVVRAAGGRAIRLGVVRSNARALKFWRRHGFIELGETRADFDGHEVPFVVFGKPL